ncbi:hypothetical protein M1146_04765 [Patescibacteria group bacterium]|nr:hypothetical protein [Patescibacteria group bacterium]
MTAANTELKEEVDVLTDQVVNHEEVMTKDLKKGRELTIFFCYVYQII